VQASACVVAKKHLRSLTGLIAKTQAEGCTLYACSIRAVKRA
jgi:hypothetical protein